MKSIILIGFVVFCFISNLKEDKKAAFAILEKKCNICHIDKKKVIFTLKNMDLHAKEIHRQVFIKKKMPKGKKFPLTEKEYESLDNWLSTLNISQN